MRTIEIEAFYVLVKAGLGTEIKEMPSCYNVKKVLNHIISQGMVGIALQGCKNIVEKYGIESVPKDLKLQLYARSVSINRNLRDVENKTFEFVEKMFPLRCIVMKGIDYAKYWPNPYYREYGDFDLIFVDENNDLAFEKGNQKACSIGATVDKGTYKHSHIHYRGLMIENHKYITNFEGTRHGKEMEKFLEKLMLSIPCKTLGNSKLLVPNSQFTSLFLLKHAQHHFLFEGIFLRHILDWMFFLQKEGDLLERSWLSTNLDNMKLKKFTEVINAYCERKLSWPIPYNMKSSTVVPEKILDEFEDYMFTPKADVQNRNVFYILNRFIRRFKRIWKFRSIHYQSFGRAIWTSIFYAGFFDRHPKLD